MVYLVGEMNGKRSIPIAATSIYRKVATRLHCNDISEKFII